MDIVVHVRDLGSSYLSALPGMAKVCMVQHSCSYKKNYSRQHGTEQKENGPSPLPLRTIPRRCTTHMWPPFSKLLHLETVLCLAAQSLRPHRLEPTRLQSMGILQPRILEWVAMPSPRGSYQARDQTQVSLIAGRFFTV